MSNAASDTPAPPFSAPALTKQGETTIALSDFTGQQKLVLYFYPKDDTPGCTAEACAFRDLQSQFAEAGATILGVSGDTLEEHRKFAEKYGLSFPLLADNNHAIATEYGVWKEKTNYGKTYMGIERTTFVIDKAGVVRKIYPRVKVEEHAQKVLEYVQALAA